MIAYNFDPVTQEYTGRETAPENPKRPGEYLFPANSTPLEPPEIRDGYARVWDGTVWAYTEDHRGTTVWKDHDTSMEIASLGPIPEGWTTERPEEALTKEKLAELVYAEKCKIAYGGITLVRSGEEYLFDTDPSSISMCNAMLIQLNGKPDETPLSWKVYCGNTPVLLSLTKPEFERVFAAGMRMVDQSFAVEGALYAELAELDESGYETFRQGIASRFAVIERKV